MKNKICCSQPPSYTPGGEPLLPTDAGIGGNDRSALERARRASGPTFANDHEFPTPDPTPEELAKIAEADKAGDEAKLAALRQAAIEKGVKIEHVGRSHRVQSEYGTDGDPKRNSII